MALKLDSAISKDIQQRLTGSEHELLIQIESSCRFSFQQMKQLAGWVLDCRMWKEDSFMTTLESSLALRKSLETYDKQQSKKIFAGIHEAYEAVLRKEKEYPEKSLREFLPRFKYENVDIKSTNVRLCPAASEKAVCCNLKTISVVDNCAMGCSYCVLQNHFDEATIKVPSNLKEKLAETKLNPNKRYRIGTGEYSDSLMWGNQNNILDDLCEFAAKHSNIILELKTKSANIQYFMENEVPKNVCCSWSLNPQIIINNEEHGTASLKRRIQSARKVADRGVKVAFHIHPMMYYQGWEEGYRSLISELLENFQPEEVLWVSLGTVTMLKGFADKLRNSYDHSKLLQMPKEVTVDGKITYSFDIREKLYTNALNALSPWKDKVFQYLCMEHKPMWDIVMDYTYTSMGEFDNIMNDSAFAKLS